MVGDRPRGEFDRGQGERTGRPPGIPSDIEGHLAERKPLGKGVWQMVDEGGVAQALGDAGRSLHPGVPQLVGAVRDRPLIKIRPPPQPIPLRPGRLADQILGMTGCRTVQSRDQEDPIARMQGGRIGLVVEGVSSRTGKGIQIRRQQHEVALNGSPRLTLQRMGLLRHMDREAGIIEDRIGHPIRQDEVPDLAAGQPLPDPTGLGAGRRHDLLGELGQPALAKLTPQRLHDPGPELVAGDPGRLRAVEADEPIRRDPTPFGIVDGHAAGIGDPLVVQDDDLRGFGDGRVDGLGQDTQAGRQADDQRTKARDPTASGHGHA